MGRMLRSSLSTCRVRLRCWWRVADGAAGLWWQAAPAATPQTVVDVLHQIVGQG